MSGITIARNFIPPLPLAVPWATGRYYGCSLNITTFNTATLKNFYSTTPFLVPNTVTATSIGVETTASASAGSLGRLAIYYMSDTEWYPGALLKDFGTFALDPAAGFQAITISQVLYPGWYWASLASDNPTTGATYRTIQATNGVHALSVATTDNISAISSINIAMNSFGAILVGAGFPNEFTKITNNQILASSGQAVPRVLIGV